MIELLTLAEKQLIEDAGQWISDFSKVCGNHVSLTEDMAEAVFHVHALQNMVMAQAAARGYPKLYRKLGEIL